MKKTFLSITMVFLSTLGIAAQDESSTNSEPKFGVKAGYTSTTLRVSFEGNSVSDNISAFISLPLENFIYQRK